VSGEDIVLSVVIPLIIAELGPWCDWLARKLLPWAARLRYNNESRASVRAEEWCDDLSQIPGQLSKLVYSLGQLTMGFTIAARREVRDARAAKVSAREEREEVIRTIRWASEMAVSGNQERAQLGIAQLGALLKSGMLSESEKDFVQAALETVVGSHR